MNFMLLIGLLLTEDQARVCYKGPAAGGDDVACTSWELPEIADEILQEHRLLRIDHPDDYEDLWEEWLMRPERIR